MSQARSRSLLCVLAVLAPILTAGLPALAASALAAAPGAEARGPVTNLPLPRFVSLRGERANVRRGPSLNQRVDWEFVGRGLPLEVTGEYGQWRRVRDADGAGGWVHHSLLSGVRTVLVRTEAIAPLHAGPSDGTAVRAYVEPRVVAEFERCEGGFCLIEAGGTGGWIARDGLWGVGAGDGG